MQKSCQQPINNERNEMKITPRTKQILKNFASINNNILLNEGNSIMTVNPSKSMFAHATVDESFPTKFGIYDLNEFLGVLGLFNEPDIEFEESHAIISSGKNSVRYLPSDAAVLIVPPKQPKISTPILTFDLESDDLSALLKASGVLKSPTITMIGDGETIKILAHDKTNPNSNNFSVEAGKSDVEFTYNLKTEHIVKLLAEKYEVDILSGRKVVFRGDSKQYLIAAEADSSIAE